jgi:hypothetical protein
MADKEKIIELFNENVRGKSPDTSQMNAQHDGKVGHWLEKMMGIKANASNSPDLYGYEMKNHTNGATTFGDWSASYYIFRRHPIYNLTRDEFFSFFGNPNINKNNRLSWSGKVVPKVDKINEFGQKLIVDSDSNIDAKYFFEHDKRKNKTSLIPGNLQVDDLTIAHWSREKLKKCVENKFNKKGWFKCVRNKKGIYESIVFGDPISFELWIQFVRSGDVYLDSSMYQGNDRLYSNWRASKSFWDNLVTSGY